MAINAFVRTKAVDYSNRPAGCTIFFRCDTEAELPTESVIDEDAAYANDTKKSFDRISGTWQQRGDSSNTGGGVAQGTSDGPSATLTHDAVNHEPPYFTVAFIMKT